MADIGIGKQMVKMTTEEIARDVVDIYKNFLQNREQIASKIDNFINETVVRDKKERLLKVYAFQNTYTILHPDTQYYQEGYKLINDIRILLGLEEINYRIGIYDSINGTFQQINLNSKEFDKLITRRSDDKAGLTRTLSTFQSLLDKQQEEGKPGEDITEKFLAFIDILEKKTKANRDNLNYGYAYEAYGHFTFKNNNFNKNTRHDIYYNYYKATRHNNEAWATGGDVNNIQYKLIRIYRDDKGRQTVSAASVTSSETIRRELTNLKMLLNKDNGLSQQDIALNLTKHFTQYQIDRKLDQGIMKEIDKALEKLPLDITKIL